MNPSVQIITSRDNDLVQRLRRLQARPGAYRAEGWVWLEGDHLCRAWIDQGLAVAQAVVTEEAWSGGRADLRALAQQAARVAVVPAALMKSVTSLESPSPLGMLVAWPQAQDAAPLTDVHTVVLDRLQDPGNAGSILRSAAAMGVRQVLALQGTVALWSPKVLRAGMGAHFGLHLLEGCHEDEVAQLTVPVWVTSSHQGEFLHQLQPV